MSKTPIKSGFSQAISFLESLYGGEAGIRTLEALLTPTRFPVVRPRPTRRLLHYDILMQDTSAALTTFCIISCLRLFVKCFFDFIFKNLHRSETAHNTTKSLDIQFADSNRGLPQSSPLSGILIITGISRDMPQEYHPWRSVRNPELPQRRK